MKKSKDAKTDIRGIFQGSTGKIAKLKISADTIADLYNTDKTRKIASKIGFAGVPILVDTNGNLYEPFGYIWVNSDTEEWEIYLEPPKDGFTVKQFLRAQNSGYIEVMYRLPFGIEISMVILRDPNKPVSTAGVLGTAKLKVEGRSTE